MNAVPKSLPKAPPPPLPPSDEALAKARFVDASTALARAILFSQPLTAPKRRFVKAYVTLRDVQKNF